MSGPSNAAVAVLDARPGPAFFPRVGVITAIAIQRRPTTGTALTPAIGVQVLSVVIDGQPYQCGASGAFLGEINAFQIQVDDASGVVEKAFIGQQVKVENLGGSLIVAYTTHWS